MPPQERPVKFECLSGHKTQADGGGARVEVTREHQQLTESILTHTRPSWTPASPPFDSDLCRGHTGSLHTHRRSRVGRQRGRGLTGHLKVKEALPAAQLHTGANTRQTGQGQRASSHDANSLTQYWLTTISCVAIRVLQTRRPGLHTAAG